MHAMGSVETTARPPTPWTAEIACRQSVIAPLDVGRLNSTPKQPPEIMSAHRTARATPPVVLSNAAHDGSNADGFGACGEECDGLRMGLVMPEETVAVRLRQAPAH